MERICTYIEQEIEQSTSFREQKLLVAEFGLLDTQLTTLISMLSEPEVGVDVCVSANSHSPMQNKTAFP
jgi:hypothetical protein